MRSNSVDDSLVRIFNYFFVFINSNLCAKFIRKDPCRFEGCARIHLLKLPVYRKSFLEYTSWWDGIIVRCEGAIRNENEDETTNVFSDSSVFCGTDSLPCQGCYVFLTQKLPSWSRWQSRRSNTVPHSFFDLFSVCCSSPSVAQHIVIIMYVEHRKNNYTGELIITSDRQWSVHEVSRPRRPFWGWGWGWCSSLQVS